MKCQAIACENGEVWTECCNGSSGCPCKGQQVFMGACGACGGDGKHRDGVDLKVNFRAIQRLATATGGYLGNPHGRLR